MSAFSIGLSGLSAARSALQTTSNNISNVYTPGYNREINMLENQASGRGVLVTDVQRQFNRYTATQLNQAQGDLQHLDSYEVHINRLDDLLADTDSGLPRLMQNFFTAISDMSAAPGDASSRQGVLGQAKTLTSQFNATAEYMDDIQQSINGQIRDEVQTINSLASQIAEVSGRINELRSRVSDEPNSLLNIRDHLITELSEIIDVKVYIQDGKTFNVTAGNGRTLVADAKSYSFKAIESSENPENVAIGYVNASGQTTQIQDKSLQSGRLGGMLAFRSEVLDPTRDQLGQLAVSLASAFNEQHEAGFDLNGNPGQPFFNYDDPVVYSNTLNPGTASFSGEFSDISALAGTSYSLRVTDAASGELLVKPANGTAEYTVNLDVSGQVAIDGVTLTVDDASLLQNGDRFQLQPVRKIAETLSANITDVAELAAAQSNSPGDNTNALALLDLQSSAIVGGVATLNQSYASMVGDLGTKANVIQTNRIAHQAITEQLRELQQSESGVNLDEEAANLVRFQQFYQANARVIDVGSTIFDTLLNIR